MGPTSSYFLPTDNVRLRAPHSCAQRAAVPVRWGWLAFVAAAHAAGLGWLAGSGTSAVPATEKVVSVRLIDGTAVALSDHAAPDAAAERTADRPGHPAIPPAHVAPAEPGRGPGRHPRRVATLEAERPSARTTPRPDNAIPLPPGPATITPPAESAPAHDPPVTDPALGNHGAGTKAAPVALAGATRTRPVDGAPAPITPARHDVAYLDNPTPAYPAAARRLGEEGTVMLRVHVMHDGHAREIEIVTASGSPRLDQAAADAVRRWRFVPARQGDEAVDSWLRVPIVFRLDGR